MGTMLGGDSLANRAGVVTADWAGLRPEEKRQRRMDHFLSPPGLEFVSDQAARNYRTRARRLVDVHSLREPDRVPVQLPVGNFPFQHYGITLRTAMYDYDQAVRACRKFNEDFAEELEHFASPWITPGRVMDLLDYRLYSWPGHRLGMDVPSVQFMEAEYMKEDEYEALMRDPSDFWLRTYLPRVCGALAPLRSLPPVTDLVEVVNLVQLMPLASPGMQSMLQTLMDIGKEYGRFMEAMAAAGPSGAACGYPVGFGAFCKAPFDTLGDTLRGTQPILKDMYRRPERLLAALDVVADFTIRSVLRSPNIDNIFMVTYPLHKGADGWMSQKQFDTFYWPSLKKVMDALIKEGLLQHMFAEGGYNSRLESINDFPKGAVCWFFDKTDMSRAKKVLGDRCCLQGNLASSLIVTGRPGEVKAECRRLIEEVGAGGGYLLSAGATPEFPKLENLRAIMEAVREYGVYRK